MNLSVIIPNYNGEELLKKNLPKVIDALSSYKKGKVQIVLVDDFSTDKSIDFLEEFIKNNQGNEVKLTLIKSEANKGFSTSVNRAAREAEGEILLLLNSDVVPQEGFLEPLLSHFSDAQVFAVGPLEESVEDGKKIPRGRGIGSWQKGFLVHSAGEHEFKDTLWVSGGSGAFRKSMWESLGGLDEIYNPFYWEDIDLSYRARKRGYKTLFEKGSVVMHEHDKGAIKSKYSKEDVKKIAYRNQFIFAWKNSDGKNFAISFLWLPYHLLTSLFSGDGLFWLGFFGAFKLLPNIIKSRIKQRGKFIKKDQEIEILK